MHERNTPDTPELVARRREVTRVVATALSDLLNAKASEIGEKAYNEITVQASSDMSRVPEQLRTVMQRLNKTSLDTGPYWRMLDAINFVADSECGRWPLMTTGGRALMLDSAVTSAAEALQMAAGTYKPRMPAFEYTEADEVADAVEDAECDRDGARA